MPKKKSTASHQMAGTYRPDRHGKPALSFPPSDGKPPRWLTDKVARAEYKRVASLLMAEGKFLQSDESVLASYASAVSGVQDCLRLISEQGQTQTVVSQTRTGSTSKIVKHPATQLLFEHQRVLLQTAAHFGLTPLARERIQGLPPDDSEQSLQPSVRNRPSAKSQPKAAGTFDMSRYVLFPAPADSEVVDDE